MAWFWAPLEPGTPQPDPGHTPSESTGPPTPNWLCWERSGLGSLSEYLLICDACFVFDSGTVPSEVFLALIHTKKQYF